MNNIYLIGYRGSGKSSVGAMVASRLGRSFWDADSVLEAEAGLSIRDIFSTEGETGFRDRESATLLNLSTLEAAVVATGGGAILRAENRQRLQTTGFVIWLRAPAEFLWQRIMADQLTAERRPNLAGGGFDEVREMLAVREPLYLATAHATVDASRSPQLVADDILNVYRQATG